MGTQKERTRSTKPDRRKRLHGEDRGRRLRLRLYTNVHDTPDTSRTTNVRIARLGDVSTTFLHAPIAKDHDGKQRDVYLWPPKKRCPQQDKIWRLKKAMYGLRSSPRAWQDYLAEVLQKLSFVRLKSEPNIYTNATRDCYIMVYVDDLLALGDKTAVDSTFVSVQKQVLLKHIGYLEPGQPQQFLGRNIDHFGNYCNLGLKDSYIDNMIEESGMTNCNTVTTPGIAHYKPTIEDEALLDHEQH